MIDKVFDKLLSGRWICTVCIIITYCILILGSGYLVIKKLFPVETFLAVFTPFALLSREIISSYFGREDRGKPNV